MSGPSAHEGAVRVAAKLYECRDAARRLLGAHYERDMSLWARVIRGVAAEACVGELAAAQKIAGAEGGMGAVMVLAAYVEMTEPSGAAKVAQA